MKKFFLGAMLFLSMLSFSQMKVENSYSYKVSEPYKVFDADEKHYFSRDNKSITVKIDGRNIMIQSFDNEKPKFISEKLYKEFLPKNGVIEEVYELGNRYYVFYSSWDGGDVRREQLFAAEIDIEKGEFVSEPKRVFYIDGKVKGMAPNTIKYMNFNFRKFEFYRSHDKSKMLVKFSRIPEVKNDKKSNEIIGYKVLNFDLSVNSESEVKMPYTERIMENLDYQLNKNGGLFLLEKIFEDDSNKDRKSKKDDKPNYHLEILALKANAKEFQTTKIDLKDKFINNLKFIDSPDDKMVFGGIYNSGSKDLDDADGFVTFQLDKNFAVINKNFIEFPLELMNQYVSEKTAKKNEKKEAKEDEDGEGANIKNLVLRDLSLNPDGSIVLTSEVYNVIAHTYMSSSGTRTTYTYYYGSVYVAKIDSNGKLGWMKKIPKNQIGSRGRGGMSFQYLFNNNNHYVVYLDNVKNIDLPLNKFPERHSDGHGGYLTCVKINDKDGSVTKGSILDVRGMEEFNLHQINMDRVFQTSENSFMMEAYKKKKEDIMLKINLN